MHSISRAPSKPRPNVFLATDDALIRGARRLTDRIQVTVERADLAKQEERFMSAHAMPLKEIRRLGLDALMRQLGPVGMVRFLQQFETGAGDYAAERHQWLERRSVEDLAREMREQRRSWAAADRSTERARPRPSR